MQWSNVTFQELGLIPPLLRALDEVGYERPTPIQRDAIPPLLKGRDLIGCAQTGTGKTAAFALPILQLLDARVSDSPRIRALILTPTRELAAQIDDSFSDYGKHLDLWHTVIFGGVSDKPQKAELRKGVDTVIATPGRLLDLLQQRTLTLEDVELFVLDEADRMLDMGFLPQVRQVVEQLPENRQTLLFSATMPDEIRALADRMLDQPLAVSVARVSAPAERVEQHLYFVDKADKRQFLLDLLRDPSIRRALVFSRTKHGANRIAKVLDRANLRSAAIHGNKSQNARTRALAAFRKGDVRVLVATDIAARGIDVDDVTHVINFDLPNIPETYVHRIGRTARAGASGIALSFCDVEERPYLVEIERLMKRHIHRVEDHAYPPSQPLPPATELVPHGRQKKSSRPGNNRSGKRGQADAPARRDAGQSVGGDGSRHGDRSRRGGRGGRGRRSGPRRSPGRGGGSSR